MEKISRYLVTSDKTYRAQNAMPVRLLFATTTATVAVVDASTARALDRGKLDEIAPAWLAPLRKAGAVVSAEGDERDAVVERNLAAARSRSAVHIALLPTSYCNMGCSYCGQEHARGRLSRNHRDLVRARVLRAINAPRTRTARIDWFGAEPLVGYAVIRDLAPAFVAAAAARGVPYTSNVVTNGSLLTVAKIDELVHRCGVTNFEITLDGPPEIHDSHRPLKNGKGSFWHIVRTVRQALDDLDTGDATFSFRTNVDVENSAYVASYIDLMAELGFSDRPDVTFQIAAVHSWGNDVSDVEVAGRDFAAAEARWLRLMHARSLRTHLLPRVAKKVVCPAVTTSAELISSTGNIFSCSEYPLVPEAERNRALVHISAADPEPGRPLGPFDDWNERIKRGEVGCSNCVFMPTCGGACPKAWDEGGHPCPSYKFNIQDRFDLVAALCGLVEQGA